MKTQIDTLKSLAKSELFEILNYWSFETIDEKNGGFIGEIDYENHKHFDAPKGSVLHARILWSFSAAYQITNDEKNKLLAKNWPFLPIYLPISRGLYIDAGGDH